MMDPDRNVSSLARYIADLVRNPPGEPLRREYIEKMKRWEAGDWNELLKIANDLRDLANSEINRRNSTKSVKSLLEDWEKRTGIHPYTFQYCYLEGMKFLREQGKRENASLVIRTIVHQVRSDLFLPSTAPPREREAAIKAQRKIEKAMRDLIDRPHEVLRPYLEYRREKHEHL